MSKVAMILYRGADKSSARPGRKQAQKRVRDARDFNNIETRAVKFFFPPASQSADGNSRHCDRNISFVLGTQRTPTKQSNSDLYRQSTWQIILVSNMLDVRIEWNVYFDTIACTVQYITV